MTFPTQFAKKSGDVQGGTHSFGIVSQFRGYFFTGISVDGLSDSVLQ